MVFETKGEKVKNWVKLGLKGWLLAAAIGATAHWVMTPGFNITSVIGGFLIASYVVWEFAERGGFDE